MPAREDTINVQLGEVLQELRPTSWRVLAEHQRTLRKTNARPDILIEEPAGWPVVIEAERENHASAETDALARLGAVVNETGRPIESAVALVYPAEVREQTGGKATRAALYATDALEYALYTATSGDVVERLPESGWLRGNVLDLAMLVQRAAIPAPRIERLVDTLEHGVSSAYGAFERNHREHTGDHLGPEIAEILGQSDDQGGQTRRMAMTVLINALIFHESLAQAEFKVDDGQRRVAQVRDFLSAASGFDQQRIIDEWRAILDVNYWPIFATAAEILDRMPIVTANEVLAPLWQAAGRLISGGVTKSHDLTGVIFQRLIADRKFLATFYTRPASAALLAGLAIPADRAPGGAEWGDEETIAALQIGDFACGTGTLLAAAYQRLSLLHELNKGDPKELHAPMMANGLIGLDVLNISVHLTAAMLASNHPDVPFDGECLLIVPYGKSRDPLQADVSVGSLDLLSPHVSPDMIRAAVALTAGGRAPEEVADLVSRIRHDAFDLVIMNPPFTRSGGIETVRSSNRNTAFSAFGTPRDVQLKMSTALKTLSGPGGLGHGHAGMASHFTDLALRKVRSGGNVALVLPLSAVSGGAWEGVRQGLASQCDDLLVVTIGAPSAEARAFSADTGMAECLLVARKRTSAESPLRATFAVLPERPSSVASADLVAKEIQALRREAHIRRLEDRPVGGTPILLGGDIVAHALDCPVPNEGSWPVAGISDLSLAQASSGLSSGTVPLIGDPNAREISVPIATIGQIAEIGPHHMDIWGDKRDQTPQGPFTIIKPPTSPEPSFPMLWAHDAECERRLVVASDSEGQIKSWPADQSSVDGKAAKIWSTATRAHYNCDLQFNSQSLITGMTDRRCVGGRAWPSAIFADPAHEYVFSLWSNSTLGLLLHWWVSNKTQSGRGTTTVTSIPNIPTLDTRALSDEQHAAARETFEAMSELRFLPFDQIDEDPARAELDRRLLVDVLGLPTSLCEPDGPIDLLRRKLAREPQIHGGKKSRVVFTDDGEKTEKRRDRD